ncbi:unnamed protein product, partial [marine sediment metagenome]
VHTVKIKEIVLPGFGGNKSNLHFRSLYKARVNQLCTCFKNGRFVRWTFEQNLFGKFAPDGSVILLSGNHCLYAVSQNPDLAHLGYQEEVPVKMLPADITEAEGWMFAAHCNDVNDV